MITQGLLVSDAKDIGEIPAESPQPGAKYRLGRFRSAIFDQYLAISQKRCRIGTVLLWNTNRNSYALYRMVLFPLTLNLGLCVCGS